MRPVYALQLAVGDGSDPAPEVCAPAATEALATPSGE